MSQLALTTDTQLPDWLQAQPPAAPRTNKQVIAELNQTMFENMFEVALVRIACGVPLKEILAEDFRQPQYEHFLRWIHKDEGRKSRYYEAQEMGAEMVASEMLEIADASDSLEDVARSTLRINTRKWLLGVWNRKRFGDVKQIEQNVTIDMGAAMADAQKRVESARTIDVESRMVR